MSELRWRAEESPAERRHREFGCTIKETLGMVLANAKDLRQPPISARESAGHLLLAAREVLSAGRENGYARESEKVELLELVALVDDLYLKVTKK